MTLALVPWLLSAFALGAFGGVHCAAMCGSICAAVSLPRGGDTGAALPAFAGARLLAYSGAGLLAGGSVAWADRFARQAAWAHPLWLMVLCMALVAGAWLLWSGRLPVLGMAGASAKASSRRIIAIHPIGLAGASGAALPFLPCGLLYAALVMAGLSGGPAMGAATMAAFALGSTPWLVAVPLGLNRLGQAGRAGRERWAVRLAGLLIGAAAAWMLVRTLAPDGSC